MYGQLVKLIIIVNQRETISISSLLSTRKTLKSDSEDHNEPDSAEKELYVQYFQILA